MEAIHDRARLVDAAAFGQSTRTLTATVPRSEIENVLSEGGQPELVLQVARRNGDDQARTLEIDWELQDLERLLQQSSGDNVTLAFNQDELERAFEADVEAHGVREAAATFAVMAAVAAVSASHAAAAPLGQVIDGGAGPSGTPVEMISDAASSGPAAAPAAPELVSDAASSGPVQATQASAAGLTAEGVRARIAAEHAGPISSAASTGPELVSDAASSGPAPVAKSPELVSDSAMSGPVPEAPQMVSDAASSGPKPVQASGPELISDAASTGPVTAQSEEASGGGFSISAPDASTTAAIAGGVALMITAAGFAVRGQRKQLGHPA
jgi:hypothetical protein